MCNSRRLPFGLPPVVVGGAGDVGTSAAIDALGLLACQGLDTNALLGARLMLVMHGAVDHGEDAVVVSKTGSSSRLEGHAALPDDDRTGRHELTVSGFAAEALADAVAAVLGA